MPSTARRELLTKALAIEVRRAAARHWSSRSASSEEIMDSRHAPRTTPNVIRLRLRDLSQLFNSLDPSPFIERDLDADAEDFIVSWTKELPSHHELKLVIDLTVAPPPERAAETQDAVRHYFHERAESKLREFHQLMRRGRISLIIGLLFLAACLTIANLFEKLGFVALSGIVRESFIIVGWVAMWRPLEIYLYDWWPLRSELRVFRRLSRMAVELGWGK